MRNCNREESICLALLRKVVPLALLLALLAWRSLGQCVGIELVYCPDQGKLYLVDDGGGKQETTQIKAIDIQTRRLVWSTKVPELAAGPIVVGGSVVVATRRKGIASEILAFSIMSGAPLWRYSSKTMDLVSSSNVVIADKDEGKGIFGLDPEVGSVRWMHTEAHGSINLFSANQGAVLTPMFSIDPEAGEIERRWPERLNVTAAGFAGHDSQIIGTVDGRVIAYGSGGKPMLWSTAFAGYISYLRGTPDYVVCVSKEAKKYSNVPGVFRFTGKETIMVLRAKNGYLVWRKTFPRGVLASVTLAIDDGSLLVSKNKKEGTRVQALDLASGCEKWTFQTGVDWVGGLVCARHRCYDTNDEGQIFEIKSSKGVGHMLAVEGFNNAVSKP